MKNYFKTIYLIPVFLILANSCNYYNGKFRKIEEDSFDISLPDWLEETDDLAPHAFYQFKSRYRNTYGIIVKDKIEGKSLKAYQQEGTAVLRNFNEITNLLAIDSNFKENHIEVQFMGDMDSEKIFYWHNTYEGQKYYYQLVMWTRSYDRKQKYSDAIEEIISSFKIKD